MRFHFGIIAAAFGLLATSNASLATDLAPPPAPRPAPYIVQAPAPFLPWQGLYMGFTLGGGFGDATLNIVSIPGTKSFNTSGILGGSTIGYNFQTGNVVFGIEGDLSLSSVGGTAAAGAPCSTCELTNDWFGTLRGRLGYAAGPWLFYGTGGLIYGDLKLKDGFGNKQVKDEAGWTAGGGVEWSFYPRWSAKLEYLYASYDNAGYSGTITETQFDENIVRAGVNYHF